MLTIVIVIRFLQLLFLYPDFNCKRLNQARMENLELLSSGRNIWTGERKFINSALLFFRDGAFWIISKGSRDNP